MSEKIILQAFYPHPPAHVWKALTEAKALGKWLMPSNFKPVVGARFQFKDAKKPIKGEVLEVEAEKRLSYTWDDGEAGSPSLVSWEITPKDGGTLLRLEHQVEAESSSFVLIEAAPNWRYAMNSRLAELLRRPPVPIVYVSEEPKPEPERRAGFRLAEVAK